MGYKASLIRRWTRRDRLAVVVVAVTVAFFTGATLVTAAAARQTTQIAAGYSPVGYVVPGRGAATVAVADLAGAETYVGVPDAETVAANASAAWPSSGHASRSLVDATREIRLAGESRTLTVPVRPRPEQTVVPGDWYAGPKRIAADLGVTERFGVRPSDDVAYGRGTPLKGVLAFFVQGTRSLLALLGALTFGAAVLVGVTVYAVVRSTVSDRRDTIMVLRATGGRHRDVLGAFAARAGLLALTGVLLGYAVGVVLPNAAVNAAVFAGVDVSLTARVTARTLSTLLPGYLLLVLSGALAGVLAARPALARPPLAPRSETPDDRDGRALAWLRPDLIGWRPLVPTAGALTVFVVLTVLLVSLAGAVGPVFAAGGATVTEPGAAHPVASTVPQSYADALRASGATASPEILLFSVVRGTPFLSRGAQFDAFANVTGASIVDGERPTGRHEAAVGADLASTLGVSVGDRLVLGGSTRAAFTRVRIAGVFSGSGVTDDQLVVSLPTARHLSNKPSGTVQFVRLRDAPADAASRPGVRVLSLDAPASIAVNESATVTASVANLGDERATARLPVGGSVQSGVQARNVTLGARETASVEIPLTATEPGEHEIRVGNRTATVQVRPRTALSVSALPARAPPNATLVVRAETVAGSPVANATVSLGPSESRTDANGTARIRVPSPGERTLRITAGNRTLDRAVTVSRDAECSLVASLEFTPRNPSFLSRPTVRVDARNPWSEPLNRRLTLDGFGGTRSWAVSVPGGESRRTTFELPRQSPGAHELAVRAGTTELARSTLTVSGDDRLAAALATRGNTTRGSSLGQAIQTVFGNLRVLLGTFVALGALVTVGSVTAAFGYAVWAQRRTIGIRRALGTPERAILARVLSDALKVGSVALLAALVAGYAVAFGLAEAGLTTAYGIRIEPRVGAETLAALVAGGLGVVVAGAAAAAIPLLRAQPRDVLAGEYE